MKQAIVQEDDFGCGAACVSFAVEKKYKIIVTGLGKKQAQTKGFMCNELKNELAMYGLVYATKFIKSKTQKHIYQEGAIVFIQRSVQYPHGHYLIRHKGQWMDPWINWPYNSDIKKAKSGFRKRLPGRAQYALIPR